MIHTSLFLLSVQIEGKHTHIHRKYDVDTMMTIRGTYEDELAHLINFAVNERQKRKVCLIYGADEFSTIHESVKKILDMAEIDLRESCEVSLLSRAVIRCSLACCSHISPPPSSPLPL